MRAKDNIRCRYSFLSQHLSDRYFCSVMLNPDFAVFNIKVKNKVENPFLILLADIGQLVVIVFGVANNFSLHLCRLTEGMSLLCKNFTNYLSVLL